MLWDLNEGKHLYTLNGGDILNAMTFSPNRYWLCAAAGPSIKIWVRLVTLIIVTMIGQLLYELGCRLVLITRALL